MIGLITYWQIFKQGLFSALINAVLGLVAAIISFNYYEPLAQLLTGFGLQWLAPKTISMLVLFIASFIIMREIFDRLIRGNMNFVLIIDRVGAAICGFVFALTVVGVIAVAFQLLPISPSFLMFDRYADDHENYQNESSLFPNPDGFVLAVIANASDSTFSGQNNFAAVNSNFLRDLYLSRITLTPGSRNTASDDSFAVQAAQFFDYDCPVLQADESADRDEAVTTRLMPAQPIDLDMNETLIMVTVRLSPGAGDQPGAADEDGKIRVPMANFRLVGNSPSGLPEDTVIRYPVGVFINESLTHVVTDQQGNVMRTENSREDITVTVPQALVAYKLDQGQVFSGAATINLVFAWPTSSNDPQRLQPQPTYIQFRRSSTKPVPQITAPTNN